MKKIVYRIFLMIGLIGVISLSSTVFANEPFGTYSINTGNSGNYVSSYSHYNSGVVGGTIQGEYIGNQRAMNGNFDGYEYRNNNYMDDSFTVLDTDDLWHRTDGGTSNPGSGTELDTNAATGNVDTPLSLPHYLFAFLFIAYIGFIFIKRRKREGTK